MATKCKSYIDVVTTIQYHNIKAEKFYEHDLHLSKEDQSFFEKLFPKMAKGLQGKLEGNLPRLKKLRLRRALKNYMVSQMTGFLCLLNYLLSVRLTLVLLDP